MTWDKYDEWKLRSPYENERQIETFKALEHEVYSTNEDNICKFDDGIIEAKKVKTLEAYYESLEEYLEETKDNLIDEFNLFEDESSCIIDFLENEQSEKEYALQCKLDEIRGK